MIAYTTLNKIREHSPCAEGWAKLLLHLGKTGPDDEPLALTTILESNGLDDAIWCLRACDGIDRQTRLYAVWCARQVQHLMTDERSIAALDVAERFANGLATDEELAAARAAAWAAAEASAWAAAWDAAWAAARDAAWAAAEASAWAAAWAAAWDAAWAAWGAWGAWDAARAAAEASARSAQADQFRLMFGGEIGTLVFLNGRAIDMTAARQLMDDELCEVIHGTVETEQEFLDAYLDAHYAKYGEPFVFN